jgi:hypothetical protein
MPWKRRRNNSVLSIRPQEALPVSQFIDPLSPIDFTHKFPRRGKKANALDELDNCTVGSCYYVFAISEVG